MQKYISLALIAALMGMSFIEPISVSVRLPQISNVYPDTFAIYWQFDKRYSDDQKEDLLVKIMVNSSFGDRLFETYDAEDSIVLIPYDNPDYAFERGFLITPQVTKTNVTSRGVAGGRDCMLRIISKNDKMEALIALVRTSPRLSNLLMLADAYEEEKCFVNAFYIYKRILSMYQQEGLTYWDQFYKRHYVEFTFINNVNR